MSKRKSESLDIVAKRIKVDPVGYKNIYQISSNGHQYIHAEDDDAVQYIFRANLDCTITQINSTPLDVRMNAAMQALNYGVPLPQSLDGVFVSIYDFNRACEYLGRSENYNDALNRFNCITIGARCV